MAIPRETAQRIIESFQADRTSNLFAQSNASHLLYEVGEIQDNFPNFDPSLQDKVTISAYSILAAAISIAEEEWTDDAIKALELGAGLLGNVNQPHTEQSTSSVFHVLISAMAFYAAGQYSRAFVSIRKIEAKSDIAEIISAFIRKKPEQVILLTNKFLLDDLTRFESHHDILDHAVALICSRALSLTLEYFASGDDRIPETIDQLLSSGVELASDYDSPSHWLIMRLLRLMLAGNLDDSLWSRLVPLLYGDEDIIKKYIRLLAFDKNRITELWTSQIEALDQALDSATPGAVVNMRTSAGKTRVAELAILQTLLGNPGTKVLYLAPFRSLAIEIEQTLSKTFDPLGFPVSHLYGGFRLSRADTQLAESSSITIATPEKNRAMLRASPELISQIGLIIVDEGHLIGANERYVKNELFLDHLRVLSNRNNSRILMLSAVLPNSDDISNWLTKNPDNVARSNWKPSSERFGILQWQGNNVRIDWRGEYESFNPRFVQQIECNRQFDHVTGRWKGRRKPFPSNKGEAIAASAIRLCAVGPVMIFSARANSIPGLASSTLTAMGEDAPNHNWPQLEWDLFEATCVEDLGEDAIELHAARKGIICHSNRLPPETRLAIERLMRSFAPKLVIASTTLAQGVNIGISSVIVSTPFKSKDPIDHRDFWNICGRAGRAFVDGEGKILYAIDRTNEDWKVRKDLALANYFFNQQNSNEVQSGLLFALNLLKRISDEHQLNFEQLLAMIAENDFTTLEEQSQEGFHYILDLVDDSLLTIQEDEIINPNNLQPELWVDDFFRNSLASLQANADTGLGSDELIQLLSTRASYLIRSIPDRAQRKAYGSSGLPISVASKLFLDIAAFSTHAQAVSISEYSIDSILSFLNWLEDWSIQNASTIIQDAPSKESFNSIRSLWLSGTSMREITLLNDGADEICKGVYGFTFPWLIHAASQQVKSIGLEEESDTLSNVAILVEMGLPSLLACWVFLSGIRSRKASTEIANSGVDLGNSLRQVRLRLRRPDILEALNKTVSDHSKNWLSLHRINHASTPDRLTKFRRFTVNGFDGEPPVLLPRSIEQREYLCTPDGRQKRLVGSNHELPFREVANDYRVAFERNNDGSYEIILRDPRAQLEE
ncbi:DEAD/DEAH box helicase [Halomonas denitrificans]|uniref:DEAD/DEAH box helicase n=1 Tax=Halomonas denitrificans TaxID=370769 RepID=UPI000D3657ED|nr:DEAD/DEAH box helicase [Halomonas denitrificans]